MPAPWGGFWCAARFECLLVSDATESYFPEFKAAAIEMIVAQGGIVGWATSFP